MAELAFRITSKPTIRDLVRNAIAAKDGVAVNGRDMMRRQGKRLHGLMQDEAPQGKTGKFRQGIRWRSFERGDEVGFDVTMPEPLGTWITGGTKPHPIPIPPRPPGKPLHFFWAKGPAGPGMYTFYNVRHPGTKPNTFPGRAYRRWLPGARADLRSIARNYARTITGAANSPAELNL